jgi:O-antigen/teichoic acid export membrane protein
MTGHTLATGRAATLIKLAFAAGAKLSAAFIAFGLTALVTRNMPNDEAGLFLLGFSILTVLSIFFRLGLDNVILRYLSAHGTDAFAQEKLNRGLLWIATIVIPSTALGMFFSEQIATHIFNKPAFGPVFFWMLLALPAMAIFMLLAMAFQAQHRVVITTIFQNLGISTIFVAAFGYLWYEQPEVLNAVTAAQIYAGAAGVIFLAAIVTWFSQKGIAFSVSSFKDKELLRPSSNLWVSEIMSLAIVWSGVIIAGIILPANELAQLSTAHRTAMLTTFILMVVNMVVAPRYAHMWKSRDMVGIERLAKWSTRGMIVLASPILLVMIIVPRNIMSLFGEGYENAALLLSIMAVGQFINVATGSVGYLLSMSGYEEDYRKVSIYIGLINLALAWCLIEMFGGVGAAISTAIGVALYNILLLLIVKKRLNFYSI